MAAFWRPAEPGAGGWWADRKSSLPVYWLVVWPRGRDCAGVARRRPYPERSEGPRGTGPV